MCFRCCTISIVINQGCAHYYTYTNINGKSVYSYSGKEALELGIGDWFCNSCHKLFHEKISFDGNTKVLMKCFNKNIIMLNIKGFLVIDMGLIWFLPE